MSAGGAILYIAVSLAGTLAAYHLGQFKVYSEWKRWLEEVQKKLEEDDED